MLRAQFDVNTYARAWQIVGPLHYPGSTECQLAIFGGNVHWDGFVGKRRNIGDIRIAFFGQLHNVQVHSSVHHTIALILPLHIIFNYQSLFLTSINIA